MPDAPREATSLPAIRKFVQTDERFGWDAVETLVYKPTGTHFRDITRQVLFSGEDDTGVEVRYFEVGPGGHSTFERHQHTHSVLILRGAGQALVGDEITDLAPFDLVRVPPMTWHQFRAAPDAPLGFLCLVACDRDRPQRPDEAQVEALRQDPQVAAFMQV